MINKKINYKDTSYPFIKKITYNEYKDKYIYVNMLTRNWIFKTSTSDNEKLNDDDIKKLNIQITDELKQTKRVKKIIEKRGISIVYLNVTYNCNLKCPGCYVSNSIYKKGIYFPKEMLETTILKLKELGVEELSIIGGEPLLYKHIKELIEITIKNDIKDIEIETNGLLINKLNINFIKKNKIKLQFSLDSIYQSINEKTRPNVNVKNLIKNIIKLKRKKIMIKVMGTLTSENIKYAAEMYNFFYKKRIPVGFFQFKDNNIDKRHLKPSLSNLINLYEEIYSINNDITKTFGCIKVIDNMKIFNKGYPIIHCGASISAISIAPDGNVYPCVKLADDKFKIGNIFDKTFKLKINMPYVNNIKQCNICEIKYYCGGGCRAERYYVNEDFNTESDCEVYKGLLNYYFLKILESN